jgi:hypothetical protein
VDRDLNEARMSYTRMGPPPSPPPASPPQGAPATAAPRASRSWAFASVLIVMMVIGGLLVYYITSHTFHAMRSVPNALREFATDVGRPKFVVHEVVVSTVEDAHRQSKLVVLNAKVNADVTRMEGSSRWGIYWGTNTARVVVRDARVQYTIDLAGLGSSDFDYNEKTKVLTVTVPRPQIDTQMVSIDPSKIETLDLTGGWARFNKRETWDHAVAELVPKVILEGSRPLVRKEADEAGKEAMLNLLQPLADRVSKEGVSIAVKYRE